MQAGEVTFQQLLSSNIQYRVPLFQRTYSWDEDNWQRLWDDLLEIYALPQPRSHFIGAVVTLPILDAPQYAAKYMLIDGQQRLTTLFILLAVIRDCAKTENLQQLSDQIEQMCLINQFALRKEEREKLLPTQQDQSDLSDVLNSRAGNDNKRIIQAQKFFKEALKKGDLGAQKIDLTKLHICITAYLSLVSIRLDPHDSPHRIFESLNNTGMPLTASDLVRNHIFMRISNEADQNAAYNTYWYPMQQRMEYDNGNSYLSDFFWRYLMMDGDLPRYDEVFESMRKRIEEETKQPGRTVENVLDELNRFSTYYLKIWKPDPNEKDDKVRKQLERLNQWEVEVAYPFMLAALHLRETKKITSDDLFNVLQKIESFVIRRLICGVPTNRMRRVFAQVAKQVDTTKFVSSCHHYLEGNEWPSDAVFHQAFQTARIYIPSRLSRTRLILTSLENSYTSTEKVKMTEQITIEHVMPQTLSSTWQTELGPNASQVYDKFLHTIGNLTYSGDNSLLSNDPFSIKKVTLSQSKFDMNRRIAQFSQWTEAEIKIRAKELADRALNIWKR